MTWDLAPLYEAHFGPTPGNAEPRREADIFAGRVASARRWRRRRKVLRLRAAVFGRRKFARRAPAAQGAVCSEPAPRAHAV